MANSDKLTKALVTSLKNNAVGTGEYTAHDCARDIVSAIERSVVTLWKYIGSGKAPMRVVATGEQDIPYEEHYNSGGSLTYVFTIPRSLEFTNSVRVTTNEKIAKNVALAAKKNWEATVDTASIQAVLEQNSAAVQAFFVAELKDSCNELNKSQTFQSSRLDYHLINLVEEEHTDRDYTLRDDDDNEIEDSGVGMYYLDTQTHYTVTAEPRPEYSANITTSVNLKGHVIDYE